VVAGEHHGLGAKPFGQGERGTAHRRAFEFVASSAVMHVRFARKARY